MRRLALGVFLATAALPAAADVAFRPVVEATLDRAILPAHAAFAAAAGEEREAIKTLCATPSETTLDASRKRFIELVGGFGRVEPFRLGPAVEDNRFDRLLFWPDRRGRGQRQVEALLAAGGEVDPVVLRGKSVAVQGLPALELVLYGTGAEALAGHGGTARCQTGLAIAAAVEQTAAELEAGWHGDFGATMRGAGDDPASLYRSHGEVVKDLLQSAAEVLQTDATLKLGPSVIGAAPGEGNPRLAPFWRSGATATLLIGNARSLTDLATPELQAALGTGDGNAIPQARFELTQAARALTPLVGQPLPDVAAGEDGHRRLVYATSPLAAAQRIYGVTIPAAFGFAAGFNALDGD